MSLAVPVVVLGGSGYVAGELLRLIAAHPSLDLAAAVSKTHAGKPLRSVFPHLHDAAGGAEFVAREDLKLPEAERIAVFSAAPHGASANLLAATVEHIEGNGARAFAVDASADFRFAAASQYEAVYGAAHAAPGLLKRFFCALPEHTRDAPSSFVGHPGCFATAMLLAVVPLMREGLSDGHFFATGITGSTGSGRQPADNTHHPHRHANVYAYKPLAHRHAPEVRAIVERVTGKAPGLHFVPHSGPFARGIHMSVQTRLAGACTADELREAFSTFYAGQVFVEVIDGYPKIKDVVGSNFAQIGVAVENDTAVVLVAIDNLLKGAAGGAMQWMNRLLGIEECSGLTQSGAGWI